MWRSRPVRVLAVVGLGLAAVIVQATGAGAQRRDVFVESRHHRAIAYATGPVDNAVEALNVRLDRGAAALAFDPVHGYLSAVLDAFGVPRESQTLVFSPTSFQDHLIDFHNPRAVYFNDAVAVGWVRGGDLLEVAVQDRAQGVIFYELPQRAPQDAEAPPRFRRNDQCLACHLSWDTYGVPGLLLMSTLPRPDENAYATGFTTNHASPFVQRWGGWYVTGRHGGAAHQGNVPVSPADIRRWPVAAGAGVAERTSLEGAFDLRGYLSPYSDVVPLLVLAHQVQATNLITRLGWEARLAAAGGGGPERVSQAARQLADVLLFVDEAPLAGPVGGASGFAERFAAAGPFDAQGRTLRALDLDRWLLRYPCSYMIYTDAFDALPAAARDAVYAEMWAILSGDAGRAAPDRYARLSLADRRAVVEILRETKADLPDVFQRTPRE